MSKFNKRIILLFVSLLFVITMILPLDISYALPSFARQTGMSCWDCHTIWPELTPMGRVFKLGGYTQSINPDAWESSMPPLAIGAVVSFSTQKGDGSMTNGAAPFDNAHAGTDKFDFPSEFNIFYGGRIYGPIGAFIQGTYDGVGDSILLDMIDLRVVVKDLAVADKPLQLGFTVNNRPTVEDIYNTTPVWSFPFQSSPAALTPMAGTLIDGGLDTQVGGLGIYAMWNKLLYADFTLYRTAFNGITKPFGANYNFNSRAYQPVGTIAEGAVPYWRVAFETPVGEGQNIMIGTYGMVSNISSAAAAAAAGFSGPTYTSPTDNYLDLALDAQYQYITDRNIITAQATWIHEYQNLSATFANGGSSNSTNTLDTIKARINYAYRTTDAGTIGATLAWFLTTGSTDAGLYSNGNQYSGSASGSPLSSGFIIEADYLPIKYIKIGAQYVLYTAFDGAYSNYDGFGTNASNSNTFYLYSRLML